MSPRLERLIHDLKQDGVATIEVENRSFALAPDPAQLSRMFGDPERAKKEILGHWRAANENDDEHRIQADLMAGRPFPYPHSTPALLACQAAAILGGEGDPESSPVRAEEAHGRYFARVQRAHLTECRDVADEDVLVDVAVELGWESERFREVLHSEEARERLESDLRLAQEWGVGGVPALVVERRWLISGAQPYALLRRSFEQIVRQLEEVDA